MDWTLALQRNQEILLRSVAWLFTWLKLEVGGSVNTLPKHQRYTVLFVLRPAESACRRLVYAAMLVRGLIAPQISDRAVQAENNAAGKTRGPRPPAFRLTDPRKAFDLNPNKPKIAKGPGPQITDLWSDDPIYDRSAIYAYQERLARLRAARDAEDTSATALCRRMNALMGALNDLDAQALRMAKLLARIKRQAEQPCGKPALAPLRPGRPPGYRQRDKHEVDEVLKETHQLVFMAEQDFPPPAPS